MNILILRKPPFILPRVMLYLKIVIAYSQN